MDIKQIIGSIVETIIKIVAAVFIVMFVYNTAIKAYDYGYRVFAEEPMTFGEGRTISIYVKSEDSVKDIGENLQEKGLIRDANLFFIQELLSEYHGMIVPGIYDLNTSMKVEEMLEIMTADYVETEEEDDSK
ncbi:MAG: aminodeoxychorismate lyase [Lachnospiraceae bacterium]|nr:aminodeoxychorismate lyase [Lachnospiraceae bacterium]